MDSKSTEQLTTLGSDTKSSKPVEKKVEAQAKPKADSSAKKIGMVPYKYMGKYEAWNCPDCGSSTTNEKLAGTHVCKELRKASDEGDI